MKASLPPDFSNWESGLPRFSLDRKIAVLVLLAATVVVGAVATLGIPLELIPRGFTAPFLRVFVPWRDSPSREVLDKIVLPLEEELSTVPGLDVMTTYSRTGAGFAFLNFKQGTDMDVAYREVRDRIERAKLLMPDDADRVVIGKHDETGIPAMVIGLAIDPGVTDPYNLIQNEIILPFSRLDGVASVESEGLQEKEILIELDRQATSAAGLNIYELARDLSQDNFTLASGSVSHGGHKLLLRSVARYPDLEALENRLLTPTVRLKDVAQVNYTEPERDWRVRVNSKPAMAVQILKEGQANTIDVARRVRAEFDRMQKNPRLAGFEMAVLFDQGDVILESLDTLLESGQIGGVFAILVLLFFLRRFRMTLIITLSIPLSLLIALTVMYFTGETLNILSLLGLMICVGLLVDNSVVVAENIHRLHRSGLPRREATIQGAGEIALAIVLATLTTIVVFLPVSLVEGQGQFFLLRLAIPISVSLAASLVVALMAVPLMVYLTLGSARTESPLVTRTHRAMDGMLGTAYRATLERLNHAYTALLAVALKRRLDTVLAMAAVFALTAAVPMQHVKMVDNSEEERRGFEVDVDLPPSYTLEDTTEFFNEVEQILERLKPEMKLDGYLIVHRRSWGEVEGWFTKETTITPREAIEKVMEELPKKPGVTYYSGQESQQEKDEGEALHAVALTGEDPDTLEAVARELEGVFVSVPGVLGLKRSGERAPSELALVVDRTRAQKQGITPQVVAAVVGYALRGQSLPRFHWDGKEIPVRVRFQEEDRKSLTELQDFAVPTASGTPVPLASLTDVRYLDTAKGIYRKGKRITRTITLELQEGQEDTARKRLAALTNSLDLPEGVTIGAAGMGRTFNDDLDAMKFAGAVSIVFIYLLMGFLFESFVLPLSIILTIPLATLGVAWLHFILGRDVDFLGVVGAVLLIGVVVNNGIVLVDYVNRLRREGLERTRAVLLSAERRFRPILMTAATTICGMIPLTVGEPSSIGMSYKSFGLTLIGGLATSTLLTLLVIPVFYTLFDDASQAMARAIGRGLHHRPGRP